MSPVRLRFAPSPTGRLHIGNCRTALFNWLFARREGGEFLVRIEDTDRQRSRPEFERSVVEDLKWLGLDWREGIDVGGPDGPYRQSERSGFYARALERLERDELTYSCFCSPEDLERQRLQNLERGDLPRYSGRCRTISREEGARRKNAGEKPAIRFRIPARESVVFEDLLRGTIRVPMDQIGDPILVRSDGGANYNFAAVVDDSAMRISHVVRGEDHLSNTARQVLLYSALGAELPRFVHLPLVMGEDGKPLAKRLGDLSIARLRSEGYLAKALVNALALLGWSPRQGGEILSLEEMAEQFRLKDLSRSPSIFNRKKLDWVNAQHIRQLPAGEIGRLAEPDLRERGFLPRGDEEAIASWRDRLVALFREQLVRAGDLASEAELLFEFPATLEEVSEKAREVLLNDDSLAVLRAARVWVNAHQGIDEDSFAEMIRDLKRETGRKGKALLLPLRVGLTGRVSGPELGKLLPVIDIGSRLPLERPVASCLHRLGEMVRFLSGSG